jgi:hypothetical protein
LKKQNVIGEAVVTKDEIIHVSNEYSFGSVVNINGKQIRAVNNP